MNRSIEDLLNEKVKIIEEKMGKKPFEALGISKEQYLRMKDNSKYTRLCECIRCNGIPMPKSRYAIGNNKQYVEKFKWFLKCASKNDKDTILSLIDEVTSKDSIRTQIVNEIKLKKRQIQELESRLKE